MFVLIFSLFHAFVFLISQRGAKAPQAAGRIHTDFEKGFIMAEVNYFGFIYYLIVDRLFVTYFTTNC